MDFTRAIIRYFQLRYWGIGKVIKQYNGEESGSFQFITNSRDVYFGFIVFGKRQNKTIKYEFVFDIPRKTRDYAMADMIMYWHNYRHGAKISETGKIVQ